MFYRNEIPPVTCRADLLRVITTAEAVGSIGTAHLLRAVAQGRTAFLLAASDMSATTFKAFAKRAANRPAVVVIGDDNGMERGPAGWAITDRVLNWARAIMIHACGAEIVHYDTAIMTAEFTHRMLIIECGTATVDAWLRLVKALRHRPVSMVILPRQGVHPAPLDRSLMS
jgi:hypothetical protein